MARSPRHLSSRLLVALALLAGSLVAVVGVAAADSPSIPLTLNASPTTSLTNGQTVTITADASSPPNPTGALVYGLEARLCKGDAVIVLQSDFNPTDGGQCINAPLSAGTNDFKSVIIGPPNLTGQLTFKVGVGTNTFQYIDSGGNLANASITCGPSNPCKLAVKAQVPTALVAQGYVFKTFPISYQASVPSAPAKPTATAGNAKATVTWTAPSDGGSGIISYTVKAYQGGVASGQTCTTGGALTCDVTGLTNGLAYTFTVLATNAVGPSGESPQSDPVTPTAPTVPAAPAKPTATAGVKKATVTWTAPANGGSAITGYTVKAYQGGVASGQTCTTGGALTCDVTGLADGTAYTFTVLATNGVGPGPESPQSDAVTTPSVPSAPAKPTASGGNTKATVTWVAPANGGSAITGYTVTAYQGASASGQTCTTGGALTCQVTGLTNGTAYTFTVKATNAVGTGAESPKSDAVTPVAGDLFHPLDAPTRILDSRPPPEQVGPYSTPWAAGTVRDVTVAGVGGVPANATAVTLNVTVTGTTAASFLTLWPKGDAQPTASNLNWSAGQTIPNAVTVKVGTGGQIQVFNPSGNATVIVDVVGYYDQSGSGDGFTSQAPARVLDSRPPPEQVGPYSTPWAAGTDRTVTVAGVAGVPADADAVVLNATVTGTTAESFLTIYPNGASKPTASSLNWKAGVTIPNAVTVKVGTGGQIRVFNNSGNANVIIDVVGYFKAGTGDAFHPLSPVRFQDSRPAPETVGAYTTPWGAGTTRSVSVLTGGAVPAGAKAILANFTVTSTSAESFATVWNTGASKPTASSLNWKAGTTIANAVTAKVGTGDTISVFNNSGTVNVIADVGGWYG